jgi:hypothetical protein
MKRPTGALAILVVCPLVALFAGAQVARADGIGSFKAISFETYTAGSINDSTRVVGWDFATSAPINITHLGYYDYAADGLTMSHDVAIYYGPGFGGLTGTQVPGASGTVASGTSEMALAGSTVVAGGIYSTFRYHNIADVTLPATLPGQFYRIAAVDGDTSQESPQNLVLAPGLTLGSAYQLVNGGTIAYPTVLTGGSSNPWSGPNFLLPEPSSAALMLAVASGVALCRRHRR